MRDVVLAHGCFDLLHPGHIRHLQEAKRLGDLLVVSVTSDRHVAKGLGRPHFTAEQRAEALRALECVDDVVITDEPDAVKVIQELRPRIYVKGVDYKGSTDKTLAREKYAVESVGGMIHFTSTHKWSSSSLINHERFPSEVMDYLSQAKTKRFRDKILAAFELADKLRICFAGEFIVDEYRYVQGLGRASKELMLATVEVGKETFNGGVAAAFEQAEWKNRVMVTAAGSITKTRLVDKDFNRKLFDIYSAKEISSTGLGRARVMEELRREAEESDVMIVFDFGHGMFRQLERNIVSSARFSAINTQTNAGNYGYNLITKYKEASLVCIDNPEARLATGLAQEDIGTVAAKLASVIDCEKFLITHGRNGSVHFDGKVLGSAPAFTIGGVDTMGAGDATLAVVAPLVASGLDLDAAAFVGNVVGAIKTTIVGHRRHVNRQEIIQTIEALLS